MDTALYYTFSTIAQALAAAMALFAAFALYRLKAISDECLQGAAVMEAETGGGINVRAMAIASNWSGVVAEINRRLPQQPAGNRDEIGGRLSRLQRLLVAQRRVAVALWVSLGLTALVVACSIGVLAYVPSIFVSCNAQRTLIAGIAATIACLLAYLWLVIEAFRTVS